MNFGIGWPEYKQRLMAIINDMDDLQKKEPLLMDDAFYMKVVRIAATDLYCEALKQREIVNPVVMMSAFPEI